MPEISDYDKFNYDYTKYWQDENVERSYENKAEEIALAKILPKKCDWLMDLGAGFGRLYPTYKDRAQNIILADYSIEGLKKFRPNNPKDPKNLNTPTVHLIALNAYHLPFRDATLDCVLSVRLIHHIEEPETFVSELGRVIPSRGKLVLEFANKKHFVAQIRYLLGKRKINPFNETPEKQGKDIFYNFHPKHIRRLLERSGFKIFHRLSVSNFRNQIFKKLPRKLILGAESVSQKILSPITFGPSIFLQAEKTAPSPPLTTHYSLLTDILCCPKCKGDLIFLKSKYSCHKCGLEFPIIDNIIDFRV